MAVWASTCTACAPGGFSNESGALGQYADVRVGLSAAVISPPTKRKRIIEVEREVGRDVGREDPE